MVNSETNTPERILEAAREVFHKKGYEGSRMQEIADCAGINKSLLHYYFRNKDTLFAEVFKESFGKMVRHAFTIFLSDRTFFEKLNDFFGYHIEFLRQNSYIPWFVLNALYEKPGFIREVFLQHNQSPELFMDQLKEMLRKEGIRMEEPYQLYINILALSVFPFVARPLLQKTFEMTDAQMEQFSETRKRLLPLFVMNALNYEKSNP